MKMQRAKKQNHQKSVRIKTSLIYFMYLITNSDLSKKVIKLNIVKEGSSPPYFLVYATIY